MIPWIQAINAQIEPFQKEPEISLHSRPHSGATQKGSPHPIISMIDAKELPEEFQLAVDRIRSNPIHRSENCKLNFGRDIFVEFGEQPQSSKDVPAHNRAQCEWRDFFIAQF
jgi:hypothetical protein